MKPDGQKPISPNKVYDQALEFNFIRPNKKDIATWWEWIAQDPSPLDIHQLFC